jgi:integrase
MLYAIATDRAENTPIPAVKKALTEVKSKHMAATTEPQKVGELLRMIDSYSGTAVVRAALKLAPLVFVRPGELRHAEWAAIDFEKAQWCFKASKTKQPHVVPLSRQALEILSELKLITGQGRYVFPAPTSKDRPMSNNAILAAFRRMGITKDEHSGHGWRATARTLLDEQLKFSVPAIEMQLAHRVKDVHGRAYNRTTLINDRIKMMQAWADYLDELKNSNPDT